MLIKDLINRDLNAKIAEVIQVDQVDEQQVHDEITDYVVTDRIRDHYRALLDAIAQGKAQPDENVGVWISGFFGSGKSSFAKNLGYVLANRPVLGESASALFKRQVNDPSVAHLVDLVNSTIPAEVVMFDISKERATTSSVSQVMYRALLRALDYAEDFDIAELEISLEREDQLGDFEVRFDKTYANGNAKATWRQQGRSGTQVWNRTGAILNQMDPRTYPTPESFARELVSKRVEVSPQRLVERAFALMERRRPGRALAFVVDEVGAFVAQSEDRLEELRAITEEFGKQSRVRVKANKAAAPTWVVVTSQEKLDEVVSALGADKRVLLAKVQDRFHYRVDLSPADIREVTTRRVLAKTAAGAAELSNVHRTSEGNLNSAARLERTSRNQDMTAEEFARFYPYLPHYIELSIDIVSGLRLQAAGTVRHIGGSNRTIISQVHQMLVNPRTNYAEKPIGALVTLDQVYTLLEGQVGNARMKDIADIDQRVRTEEVTVRTWAPRAARVIALLEQVRDLPRTPRNIAALLVDRVDARAPEPEVKRALEWLTQAEFVRETDQGFKLQTAQEKNWSTERKGHSPRPKERNEIKRELLREIFDMPALKTYNFRGIRNLRVGINVDGASVSDTGQIPLSILVADDAEDLPDKLSEARAESRQPARQNDLFWVFALSPEADGLVTGLYASRQMTAKYGALQAQNKITPEEQANLTGERQEEERLKKRLRDKMIEALGKGHGVFQGNVKDASELGTDFTSALRGLFDASVPNLYPKLEMGTRALKGSEPIEILTAANFSGLSQVFYANANGLGLVVKQGEKLLPDVNAPVAAEVMNYLKNEHKYGNRVTGKSLFEHFSGIGYGWDYDILRLVTATLLRAGAIEVTHMGRRFRNHQDPQCRAAFEKIPQFNGASFAPRETIDLKALIAAVQSYEALTGDDVDVEEGAIAAALKKLANEDLAELLPAIATAQANQLPVETALREYEAMLRGARDAASDDCVRMLAGEGKTWKAARDHALAIRAALSDANLALVREARATLAEVWPALRDSAAGYELAEQAEALERGLSTDAFYEQVPTLRANVQALRRAYRTTYLAAHTARNAAYAEATERVRARPEWAQSPPEQRDVALQSLEARRCPAEAADQVLPDGATRCPKCGASLSQLQMEAGIAAALEAQAIARLRELAQKAAAPAAPEDKLVRVRLADYFAEPLATPQAVDEAVDALRAELQKRVAEGFIVIVE
jgi:hypothetical protein